ncbi:MAG: hypothetical protein R3B53_00475 [Candidatus Paceibacterota bacterium]
MKWIGISGSWKLTNDTVENDVRAYVKEVINRGDGIVSGGALGVDFFAVDEALKYDPKASRIKIFIASSLENYISHYRKRAGEGVITRGLAEGLISQLSYLKKANPEALVENLENEILNTKAYYERITQIVAFSDELAAFQVNDSEGTQDTINKAKLKGIPVFHKKYSL